MGIIGSLGARGKKKTLKKFFDENIAFLINGNVSLVVRSR